MVLDPKDYQPGDIGFARTSGIMGRAIRYAERREGLDDSWNHAFALSHKDDAGNWVVVQAEIKGVTNFRTLDKVAPGGKIEIYPFPDATASRSQFLEFLDGQVKDDYSWLSIISCVLDMVLPQQICLRRAFTWICSGLIAAGLTFAGYPEMVKNPDLYTTTPACLRKLLPQ